ncbi:hypothetical protein EN871_33850, partial [bacterium M00.F.Ca.ET.228.01.1.1]
MAINQFFSQEVAPAEQQGGAESSRPLLKQSDFDCKSGDKGQPKTEVVSATGTAGEVEDVNADFEEATRNLQCEGVITIT